MSSQAPVAAELEATSSTHVATVLVAVFAHNEEKIIGSVLDRLEASDCLRHDETILLDDCSSDRTAEIARERGFKVLSTPENRGIGAAMRHVIEYAREHRFDIVAFVAGNDKDRPCQLPRLVDPILDGTWDVVQGSRYLPGSEHGNMPLYRQICTRFIHPWLFSLVSGQRFTDSTNGFRAYRVSIFDDSRLDLDQSWLDRYELEPYLLFKTVRLGYRVREVAVTKVYPPRELAYSKMKPITGWWSILRPIFLLALGIKR